MQLWVAPKRHGRTEMWKLYKKMLQDAGNPMPTSSRFYRMTHGARSFCDIIVDYHDTVAFNILQLMLDINRTTQSPWGIGKHETYQDDNGDYYLCTQWVEMAFSCTETQSGLEPDARPACGLVSYPGLQRHFLSDQPGYSPAGRTCSGAAV